MNKNTRPARRGAAYLIALLAGSIVTVTGLAALSMTTSRARTMAMSDHAARARSLTRSGLEHAKCAIAAHLDGGGTRGDIFGAAEPSINFDGGTFGWSMRRMDGSAIMNTDEPIVLRAKAEHGPARYGMQAIFPPSGVPYDVLDTGMYVAGGLQLGSTSNLISDKVVGAITEVNASAATINAPVESPGEINGSVYLGTTTVGVAERRMPDPSLIDYYVALGETINLGSLPTTLGTPSLKQVLLSPASNPYGSTNEFGIYIIDCAWSNVLIQEIRVVGTLVLLNSTSSTLIARNTLIEPAYSWMPSLLVQGDVTFGSTNSGPSEVSLGINLNPAHTPSAMDWDATADDTYLGGIEGVSYVTGDAVFSLLRQNFRGTLIVGRDVRILTGSTVNITYDPNVATLPPYGFFEDNGGLAIDPSTVTWQTPF